LSSSLHVAPRSLLAAEARSCGGERTASRLAQVGTPFEAAAALSDAPSVIVRSLKGGYVEGRRVEELVS